MERLKALLLDNPFMPEYSHGMGRIWIHKYLIEMILDIHLKGT